MLNVAYWSVSYLIATSDIKDRFHVDSVAEQAGLCLIATCNTRDRFHVNSVAGQTGLCLN